MSAPAGRLSRERRDAAIRDIPASCDGCRWHWTGRLHRYLRTWTAPGCLWHQGVTL